MRKFDKGELYCKKCGIHDSFFGNGGSWAPDSCPECGGTECITYENMSHLQKSKARDLFFKMWRKKFNLAPDAEI
jgi:hypothetical protein